MLFAFLVFALVFLMAFEMVRGSSLSLHKFGLSFLTGTVWDPVADNYGALPFIFGTIVSSLLALLFALPLSPEHESCVAVASPRDGDRSACEFVQHQAMLCEDSAWISLGDLAISHADQTIAIGYKSDL